VKLLRPLLCLALGLPALAQGADTFRHLLNEWPVPAEGSGPARSPVEAWVSPRRGTRWDFLLEWLRLRERVNSLVSSFKVETSTPAGLFCSTAMLKSLQDLQAKVQERLDFYNANCLQGVVKGETCRHEGQRVSESALAIADVTTSWKSCFSGGKGVTDPFHGEGRIDVWAGLDTKPRGLAAHSSVFAPDISGHYVHENSFQQSRITLRSLADAGYGRGEGSLLNYRGDFEATWKPGLWEISLGGATQRTDQELRPVAGTTETLQKHEARALVRVPYGDSALRLTYAFRRYDSALSAYSGLEQAGRLSYMVDEEQGFSRGLFVDAEIFRADPLALLPDNQALAFGLLLTGPLQWGGEGLLVAAIEERRDVSGFVSPYPRLEFAMKIGNLPGYAWKGEPVGGYFPRTFEIDLRIFLRPERTWWSSTALVLGAEPGVLWHWGSFDVPLHFSFRFEDHKAAPGGARQEFNSGVRAQLAYEIIKNFKARLRVDFDRHLLIESRRADSRLWASPDSYSRWYAGAGASYDF